jgi:4-hydroxyphenylacetate 3-hydroxylase C terminal
LRSTPQYRAFSGRQQLYERYYSGDPLRLAGTLYDFYDKEVYVDDLESRQNDLDCELGFRPCRTAAD